MIFAIFILICYLVINKILTEESLRKRIKFLEEQLEKERDKR